MSRYITALALSVLLAACGGGGGDTEPEQAPAPGTIGAAGGVQASVNGLGLQK